MLCFSLFHTSLLIPRCTQCKLQPSAFKHTHFPYLRSSPNSAFFIEEFSGFRSKFSSVLFSDSRVSYSVNDDFDIELGRLLALLPEEMRIRVSEHPELYELIEVVMDLGRKPLARFPSGDFSLSDCPITVQDIEHATSQVKFWFCNFCLLCFDYNNVDYTICWDVGVLSMCRRVMINDFLIFVLAFNFIFSFCNENFELFKHT